MPNIEIESLSYDPIHGYIPFVSSVPPGEIAERDLIDNPWLQRLRQIHQLQTAWWVYPTAEHSRFQHVLGAMHLATRMADNLYDSLREVCPDVPSRGFVVCTVRLAALLHDVGHGPFGHFFDAHFLTQFGLTHETLGAHIIENELSSLLKSVRRAPGYELARDEALDPQQIAFLIQRPRGANSVEASDTVPRWLEMLRILFCGIYTVDNMDFVLRDAYMTGYSSRAFELDRLLHYSFFSEAGLTIHERGLNALLRFLSVRNELFRTVYFHRTVRAIDKSLELLFRDCRELLFPGDPLAHLEEYRQFTEWSLLVDVAGWGRSDDPIKRSVAPRWQDILERKVAWKPAAERTIVFAPGDRESASLFGDVDALEAKLAKSLSDVECDFEIDLARHLYRPDDRGPVPDQNYLAREGGQRIVPLAHDQLVQTLPISHRICRVYVARDTDDATCRKIAATLDALLGGRGSDDLTNM